MTNCEILIVTTDGTTRSQIIPVNSRTITTSAARAIALVNTSDPPTLIQNGVLRAEILQNGTITTSGPNNAIIQSAQQNNITPTSIIQAVAVQQHQHVNPANTTANTTIVTGTLGVSPKIEPSLNVTGHSSRSHSNAEKPFQCNVCERKFRQLSTLTNHVKIHTGEKPFKCSICDKNFRQSSTLTNHLKIHTGEKPFICTYCNKQFRQLSTLTNHLKIHTGEKPFECAVCKKQFRQSSTLNNHIKIHVMDKLYIPQFEIKTEDEG